MVAPPLPLLVLVWRQQVLLLPKAARGGALAYFQVSSDVTTRLWNTLPASPAIIIAAWPHESIW